MTHLEQNRLKLRDILFIHSADNLGKFEYTLVSFNQALL